MRPSALPQTKPARGKQTCHYSMFPAPRRMQTARPGQPNSASTTMAATSKQQSQRGQPMNLLRFVVDAFVNTFGITRPSPSQEAAAGRYIALMLLAVLLFLVAIVWLLHGAFAH
jgi:hypothetical protein